MLEPTFAVEAADFSLLLVVPVEPVVGLTAAFEGEEVSVEPPEATGGAADSGAGVSVTGAGAVGCGEGESPP